MTTHRESAVYHKAFVVACAQVLGKKPDDGRFRECTLPDGRKGLTWNSYNSGMIGLSVERDYRNSFGDAPEWVRICHLHHQYLLMRMAAHWDVQLPAEMPTPIASPPATARDYTMPSPPWAPTKATPAVPQTERARFQPPEPPEPPEKPELVAIDDLDADRVEGRLVQRLPQLLRHVAFRKAVEQELGERGAEIVRAIRKGQPLEAAVWEDLEDVVSNTCGSLGKTILVLEWDTGSPMGGAGFSSIEELAGVYWFRSSDWESKGPFDSLDEALRKCDSFSMATAGADLSSEVLSQRKLIEIGKELAPEDGDTVFLNGEEFVRRGKRLQRTEED